MELYDKIQRNKEINDLKNTITNLFISYNKLISKEAIDNRENDDELVYKKQKNTDNIFILSLRNNALDIFDKCNRLLMK